MAFIENFGPEKFQFLTVRYSYNIIYTKLFFFIQFTKAKQQHRHELIDVNIGKFIIHDCSTFPQMSFRAA